ncbi:MAG: hypothetical protein ACT4P7_22815 [Gemmatimonadaceae bacterium]
MNLPVACTLSDEERPGAADQLLSGLAREATVVEPLEHGYRARFRGAPGVIRRIGEVIERERGCCTFLTFDLRTEPNDGDITLTITGPAGTRAFLDHLLTT